MKRLILFAFIISSLTGFGQISKYTRSSGIVFNVSDSTIVNGDVGTTANAIYAGTNGLRFESNGTIYSLSKFLNPYTFSGLLVNTAGTISLNTITVAGGGTGATDAATARSNLGLTIGTNVQAFDATLQSIASTGTVADRTLYTTGVDTWAETPLTSFSRTLLDDTNQSGWRTTLGLTPGTDVQAFDADLTQLAGFSSTGIPVRTAANTWALATIQNPLVLTTSTLDILDAGVSQDGIITTGTQSFAGNKTFLGTVTNGGLSLNAASSGVMMSNGTAQSSAIQISRVTIGRSSSGFGTIGDNYNVTTTPSLYNYFTTGTSAQVDFSSGNIALKTAVSGTAGDPITYDTRLTVLNSNGNVGIGITPTERLHVSGNGLFTGTITASNYNPGTNVASFLATPSSANLRAALTDEVGTGAAYFVGGALGTPASVNLTNGTALPIGTGISGAGSTDNAIIRTNGTAGTSLQNSTPTINDDGRIQNVTDPSSAQDVATKNYIDNLPLGALQVVTVNVSSSEILNLFSSPKTLIAAPGAGQYIQVLHAYIFLDVGTPYSNTTTSIQYATGQNIIGPITTFLSAGSDTLSNWPSIGGSTATSFTQFENSAVQYVASGSNPTTGTGTISINIIYRIVTP